MEWLSLLIGLLSIPSSASFIISWLRNRRQGVPPVLRRTLAGVLAIIYLGWAVLDVLGSGVLAVNASRQPGFFAPEALAYNTVLAVFFLFITLLLPGGAVGFVISKLDPEHWPEARTTMDVTKEANELPYIQTVEKVARSLS